MVKIPSIPQVYRHVNRWREILTVLSKYGLADWIYRLDFDFAKGLLRNRDGEVLARHTREKRIRLAIEELGPTFIKLGQILSTRPDLVGVDLADELKNLQANVPADPPDVVRQTVAIELGRPVEDLFLEFDDVALASASIGQVHRARLRSGERVVVKVQHQGIHQVVRVDLDLMAGLAQLAERLPELACYRPVAVFAEFRRTLRRELDFRREQRNLQQFRHEYCDNPTVHIPRPYPGLSTDRVLTMELLEGLKLLDAPLLERAGLDLEEFARRGADLYLEMIFIQGQYHADPHPGNIVLLEDNVIGLLDFGMVGRLDESLRDDVSEMLMAIVDHDADYLTRIIMRIGAVPAELDESGLRVDVADFVDHYGNQPIDAFDLSGALREMVEIIRRYHIVLPGAVAMLIKVLIMLEGTARLLSPHFSLIEVMQPYRRKMQIRRLSPTRRLRRLRRTMHEAEQLFEELPRRMMDILQQVESGQFDVHLDHRGLEPSVNRLVLGMLTSALFLGSSILMSRDVGPSLGGISIIGGLGYLMSIALGLRVFRAINKSGHLDRRK